MFMFFINEIQNRFKIREKVFFCMLSFLTLLNYLLPVFSSAETDPAFLLKNLNTSLSTDGSSSCANFTKAGDTIFFTSMHKTEGMTLWKTDGTTEGTTCFMDFYPGGNIQQGYIMELTNFNGILFFAAEDPSHGAEIWRTDGTPEGTYLIKDINPGPDGSDPSCLTVFNSELYFSAFTENAGYELWKTDGTNAGTILLKDINPGKFSSRPLNLTPAGTLLYFSAFTNQSGRELWKTDGTTAGTSLVINIFTEGTYISPNDSCPRSLKYYNGKLYFFARLNYYFDELYSTEGTAETTTQITFETKSSSAGEIAEFNNEIYFTRTYYNTSTTKYQWALWKTDGTPKRTTIVQYVGSPYYAYYGEKSAPCISKLNVCGGLLYFSALSTQYQKELWKSDGTSEGTNVIKDIYTGKYYSSLPGKTFAVNNKILFVATNETNGRELWITDGTDAGTNLFKDIYSGKKSSFPAFVKSFGNFALFSADNGTNGGELWITDGTPGNTKMLSNLRQSEEGSSNPFNMRELNGNAVFCANGTDKKLNLYKTDFTQDGTTDIYNLSSGYPVKEVSDYVQYGNNLFFVHPGKMYKTDGTKENTSIISGFSFSSDSEKCKFSNIGNKTVLRYYENNYYSTPYYYVKIINIDTNNQIYSDYSEFSDSGYAKNDLYYSKSYSSLKSLIKLNDVDLTDNPVSKILFQTSGYNKYFMDNFTNYNDECYFISSDMKYFNNKNNPTCELKKITENDQIISLLKTYSRNSIINPTPTDSFMFFLADDSYHGFELWRTDGTAAGTIMIKDINPGTESSFIGDIFKIGKKAAFVNYDDVHGSELWISDGTEEGTKILKDINQGTGGSNAINISWIEGTQYFAFSASDGIHGQELWVSDGTEEGTVMVMDINQGMFSSNPAAMKAAGDYLLFAADDGTHGSELWAMPLSLIQILTFNKQTYSDHILKRNIILPEYLDEADINDDNIIDILDVIQYMNIPRAKH